MGEHLDWDPIGVLGTESSITRFSDALPDRTVLTGDPTTIYDQDPGLVVTTGIEAFRTALSMSVNVPIAPVGIDAPFATKTSDSTTLLDALKSDDVGVVSHPVMEVTGDDVAVPAMLDATLMTDEPARISEYGITDDPPGPPETVRADGVVIATPAGSTGYAAAAGGPYVDSETECLVVVPVAPFAVDRRSWVLQPPIAVSVRRDEGTVTLYADGGPVTQIAAGGRVTMDWQGTARIATPSTSDEKT